jgi:hypothetical protein
MTAQECEVVNLWQWYNGNVVWTNALSTLKSGGTYGAGALLHAVPVMHGNSGTNVIATLYGDLDTNTRFTDHWQGCR